MFTIWESAVGALLVRQATTAHLAECGTTVGFSSVLYNALVLRKNSALSLCAGMIAAVLLCKLVLPEFLPPLLWSPQNPNGLFSLTRLVISGALVGWGTSWGCGCTSGHMLCGISLRRWRSFVATVVFSSVAMLVANFYSVQFLPPCAQSPCYTISTERFDVTKYRLTAVALSAFAFNWLPLKSSLAAEFKAGLVFGLGLLISGMADPTKPLRFLALLKPNQFDPSLLMIVVFAIVPNFLEWPHIIARGVPKLADSFRLPTSTEIPFRFLLGNAIFGLGWGLSGICPGPAILDFSLSQGGCAFVAAFIVAAFVAKRN